MGNFDITGSSYFDDNNDIYQLSEAAAIAADALWNFQNNAIWYGTPEDIESLNIQDLTEDEINILDEARIILGRYAE